MLGNFVKFEIQVSSVELEIVYCTLTGLSKLFVELFRPNSFALILF